MEQVLIIFVLVFFNAYFSLSEVALISARKNRLELDAKAGSRAARMALKLQGNPDLYLSTAQIGITIVSILTIPPLGMQEKEPLPAISLREEDKISVTSSVRNAEKKQVL